MSIADSSLHVMATLCHLSLPLYFLPPHPSPSNSTCLQSDFHSASIADFDPRALDRQSAWLLLFYLHGRYQSRFQVYCEVIHFPPIATVGCPPHVFPKL